jgi:hypothetical protein
MARTDSLTFDDHLGAHGKQSRCSVAELRRHYEVERALASRPRA